MFIGTPWSTLIPCLLGHPVQLWSHVYWDTLINSDSMFIGTPYPTCLLGHLIQLWSHVYWDTLINSDPMFIETPCTKSDPMFIVTPWSTMIPCLLGHLIQLVYWDTLSNSDPMFIGTPYPTLIPCLLGHAIQLWSNVYWDTLSNPEYSKGWHTNSGKRSLKDSLMSELLFCFLVHVFPREEGSQIQPENWTRRKFKKKKRKPVKNMSEY